MAKTKGKKITKEQKHVVDQLKDKVFALAHSRDYIPNDTDDFLYFRGDPQKKIGVGFWAEELPVDGGPIVGIDLEYVSNDITSGVTAYSEEMPVSPEYLDGNPSGVEFELENVPKLKEYFFNAAAFHEIYTPIEHEELELEPEPERVFTAGEPAYHFQFREILEWLKHDPVWMYSAPAAGKSFMAEQMAEELGVDFYPINFGPNTSESRLTGFPNIVNGEMVEGLAYKPFKNGGLLFMDELDGADSQVLLCLNGMLDGDYYRFPNGELVRKHKNFYALAGANTNGLGNSRGMKRNVHDAALLSRFIRYRLEYDIELECFISGVPNWASYVVCVREWMSRQSTGAIDITPRVTYQGSRHLKNGGKDKNVYRHLIGNHLNPDVANRLEAELQIFNSALSYKDNPLYQDALARLKSN